MTRLSRRSSFSIRLSLICAIGAFAAALVGFWRAGIRDNVGELLYRSAALLTFEPAPDGYSNPALTAAMVLVLLFALFGAVALLMELYRPFSDALIRARFRIDRLRGRSPAIVIGLGRRLRELVKELRASGRPVYAIDVNDDTSSAGSTRDRGALVIVGDATESRTRFAADLANTSELFVATGDDLRNIVIVAGLLEDLNRGRVRRPGSAGPLTCYVHADDLTRSGTVDGRELLRERAPSFVTIETFSSSDLAAHDLFFNEKFGLACGGNVIPSASEAFHLFVFGFGSIGQAVARHVARFAHFASRLRPRTTIYGDFEGEAGKRRKREFLERHPGYSLPDLDLSSDEFLSTCGAWGTFPGRPGRAHVVDHAVSAEFRTLPYELESATVADEIAVRTLDAPVRCAVVVCFDDEQRTFRAGLRVRDALAQRFMSDAAVDAAGSQPLILPVYCCLSREKDLAALAASTSGSTRRDVALNRAFPLRVFGQLDTVASYDAITRKSSRPFAEEIRSSYAVLSGGSELSHPDFDESNYDAAVHAERVKFRVLGLTFVPGHRLDNATAAARALHPVPLLQHLVEPAVVSEAGRVTQSARLRGEGISPDDLQRLSMPVRQHLAVLGRIPVPSAADTATDEENECRLRIELIVQAAMNEVVRDLDRELRERGHDADVIAEMEHNRWMGERLLKGWRYGARSTIGRQRPSFVPWSELSESERNIDRAQLAALIVGKCSAPVSRGSAPVFAYVSAAGIASPTVPRVDTVRSHHAD